MRYFVSTIDSTHHTLLAASGSGRLLLSDDLQFRMLGKELFGLEGIWLQPILMKAVDLKILPREKYNECIIKYIKSNYDFISLDPGVLLYLAESNNWKVSADFKKVASPLGGENVDIVSSLRVMAEFLVAVWKKPIPTSWKEDFSYAMLNALTSKHNSKMDELLRSLMIAVLMYMSIGTRDYNKQALDFIYSIKQWCEGHFISMPSLK